MSEARFRGSKFLTFRGHVLRSCVILLARAIAVSPWLGGPGCALPCFGFIGFRVSLCRAGCRIVGCRIVGCRIALEMGFRSVWECFRSGRAQKPHTSPTTPARALKKIYTGRVKRKHGVWCLEREEHKRVSRGVLETEHGRQEREKERESEGWVMIKRLRSWT